MTTPGMDNLGESAAGGGIAGIALGVANSNERLSGLHALGDVGTAAHSSGAGSNHLSGPQQHSYSPYSPYDDSSSAHAMNPAAYSSQEPIANPVASESHPSLNSHSNSAHDGYSSFSDDPYQYQARPAPFAAIDPNEIEDDGDDGIPQPQPKRKTLLGKKGAAAGAAGAGAAGAAMANLSRDGNGNYGPVPGENTEYTHDNAGVEKSQWGAKPNKNGKKRLLTILLVAFVVMAVIVGVVVGGVLGSRAGSPDDSKSSAEAAAADEQKNGDLGKDSDEIKKLLDNPDLHRVFPGMDYTPLNAQYPDCLHNPPSQNNVTRDVAVMSQLTPAIRLYGTDCNQVSTVST